MQTLSYMRRNSTHHRALTPYLLFIGAILYESLASMSLYFTPLLGVGFYYIFQHIYEVKRFPDFIMIFIYTLYVEIDRGLIPLSFLFFTLIFYKIFFRSFKEYIHCHICLIIAYVTIGYLGYFFFNLFITYILQMPLLELSGHYIFYILTDIFIVLVFL